ncbi:MAG TPA: sugar ABC transporter substrate-binding protein [Gryllotalpicola sp.]
MPETHGRITRRSLLKASAVGGLGLALTPLLEACASGSGSTKSGTVTLNVWMVTEPSRTWIQDKMVSEFQKKFPDIKLNITKSDFTTYYQKLTTNMAAGTTPDVFMMSGAYFYQAAHLNALHELDSFMKKDKISLDDYFAEPSGEDEIWRGKTFGIPGEIDVLGLAYNKDMFDDAGIKYPDETWDWAQLLDAAQKMTKKRGGKDYYGFYSQNSGQEMWGNLLVQNGGSFLNEDLTKGALDNPAGIEAIQFAVDLIRKYKVSPSSQGVSSLPGYIQSSGNPFLTGLIGMKFQGNYEMALLSDIKGFNWDVAPMPRQKVNSGLGWFQSWVMGSHTQHPDEAWELLKFFVTEGQTITASSPGRGLTPALKSAASSADFVRTAPPSITSWLTSWDSHGSFGFHPAWFEYQAAYSSPLDAAFAGTSSVKDAIAKATPAVNAALQKYSWFSSTSVKG